MPESVSTRETPVVAFLRHLDGRGIRSVAWKNLHELDAGLSGERDLDLLFRVDDLDRVLRLAAETGWVEVHDRRNFREERIRHLLLLDDGGELFHIHAYFGVLTGESWLKEYDLPLTDLLFADTVRYLPELEVAGPVAGRYLFDVRYLLKSGSMISRALYRREGGDYEAEYRWLTGRETNPGSDDNGLKPDPLGLSDLIADLRFDQLDEPAPLAAAAAARHRLRSFRRLSPPSMIARRSRALVARLLKKREYAQNRRVEPHGLIVAVSGSDGAGKSTVLDGLAEDLAAAFAIKRTHLGRPIPTARRTGGPSTGATEPPARSASAPSVWKSVVLAAARLARSRLAAEHRRRGHVVLADRWPTDEVGAIDGPRLDPQAPGRLRRVAARVETALYRRVVPADLLVFLHVDVDTALARNRQRQKDGT